MANVHLPSTLRPLFPGLPRQLDVQADTVSELIDHLEAVVVRHPATTFIGAHVGCAAEDLGRVSTILERCPNFNVDIAARLAELGRQPYTARTFFLRWADRILFGTYAGREIRLDGEEYVIIMKEDGHADRHTPLAERRRARRNHG